MVKHTCQQFTISPPHASLNSRKCSALSRSCFPVLCYASIFHLHYFSGLFPAILQKKKKIAPTCSSIYKDSSHNLLLLNKVLIPFHRSSLSFMPENTCRVSLLGLCSLLNIEKQCQARVTPTCSDIDAMHAQARCALWGDWPCPCSRESQKSPRVYSTVSVPQSGPYPITINMEI